MNWDGIRDWLTEARLAYEGGDINRCRGCIYMMKLLLDDVDRSIKSGVVHPSGIEKVQIEFIREDRADDRESSAT